MYCNADVISRNRPSAPTNAARLMKAMRTGRSRTSCPRAAAVSPPTCRPSASGCLRFDKFALLCGKSEQAWVVERQQWATVQVPHKVGDPQAAHADARRQVKPVQRQCSRTRAGSRRDEPKNVDPSSDNEHTRDDGQPQCAALEVLEKQ